MVLLKRRYFAQRGFSFRHLKSDIFFNNISPLILNPLPLSDFDEIFGAFFFHNFLLYIFYCTVHDNSFFVNGTCLSDAVASSCSTARVVWHFPPTGGCMYGIFQISRYIFITSIATNIFSNMQKLSEPFFIQRVYVHLFLRQQLLSFSNTSIRKYF